jgi:renalase
VGANGVTPAEVIVLGGGIAGVACARRLHQAGQAVRVLERDDRLGGRMAVRSERIAGRPHRVDVGAPYFTVRDPGFAEVVAGWQRRGLARKWTDRFSTANPAGLTGISPGPQRWSATQGMSALVESLAEGLDVRLGHPVRQVDVGAGRMARVDGESAPAVVLAMPDPEAARLLPPPLAAGLGLAPESWTPVLAVWAAWPERTWPEFDAIFVADSPVISWVADSGRSRGDGAPVLVVHSTPEFAADRSADPSAIQPMLTALSGLLGGLPDPEFARVRRWPAASLRQPHPEPFACSDQLIGVCGDGWGPRSRIEQAWLSGASLAQMLLNRLPVS